MASAKKLPSGSWRVNLYIGKSADGKRQYKSFTADTKKEAEYLAAQYNQLKIDDSSLNITLKKATENYINSKENVISPSTLRSYKSILDNNVQDLMAMKLKDITQRQVQTAFNEFALNHSPKTCRNVHNLISAVLKLYKPELTLRTTLPQKKKRDIYVPDSAEVDKIREQVKGTEIEIPFILAAQCGLRASEISGLEKSSVHDDHIEIRQARVQGENGAVLKDPKSFAGFRSVPISKTMSEYLRTHAEEERVCPLTSLEISRRWSTFREKQGLDDALNFHALRHHFASKCLLLGMPQKYIAELMGHNSVDMIERVYQHTFPSAMEQYAAKLRKQNDEFMQHEMQHKNP